MDDVALGSSGSPKRPGLDMAETDEIQDWAPVDHSAVVDAHREPAAAQDLRHSTQAQENSVASS